MNAASIVRARVFVDLKNVSRDALLLWIPLAPLLLSVLLRLGVPRFTALAIARWGVDLHPYYPLLMGSFIILAPALAGTVVGFLLLDERDDRVLLALLVTPLPPGLFLGYRLGVPILLGLVMTLTGYPVTGLLPLRPLDLVAISLLASLTGPLLALFLAGFAANKVAGLALVKLINGLMVVPIAAYFAHEPLQWFAGIIPTFWPLKVLWLAAEGERYWPYLVVGIVVHAVVLALLLRRLEYVLHREG